MNDIEKVKSDASNIRYIDNQSEEVQISYVIQKFAVSENGYVIKHIENQT